MEMLMAIDQAKLLRDTAGLCLPDTIMLARHYATAQAAIDYLCGGAGPAAQLEKLRASPSETARRAGAEDLFRGFRAHAAVREGII